jgi:hypothetical protein
MFSRAGGSRARFQHGVCCMILFFGKGARNRGVLRPDGPLLY